MISSPIACALCAEMIPLPFMATMAIAQMLFVVLISWRYLDTVRVLLVFGILSLLWCEFKRLLLWHMIPDGYTAANICLIGIMLGHQTGILAALLLKWLSTSRLFQKGHKRMKWRHAFSLVPVWLILFAGQVVWIDYRAGR
jgi:hypothetical protein